MRFRGRARATQRFTSQDIVETEDHLIAELKFVHARELERKGQAGFLAAGMHIAAVLRRLERSEKQLAEAKTEAEERDRDAERWRFLMRVQFGEIVLEDGHGIEHAGSRRQLERAIDAAMQAAQGGTR